MLGLEVRLGDDGVALSDVLWLQGDTHRHRFSNIMFRIHQFVMLNYPLLM